ncbi:uncharacterized protein [Leptinotarsa decemlineata]|uniref:uncharacterized protein n=1 Tax=Leptinotarsa decemlineata TaxID=7539 RepID=UPI003D3060F1
MLHLILDHVADSKNEAIVAGDFNAKSPSWNSPITDARGTYMDEALQALDIVVLNEGSTPTFTRGATASYIDVTFATQKTSRLVHSWRVSTGESLSIHRHIFYDINKGNVTPKKKWVERPRPQADVFRDAFRIAARGVNDIKRMVKVIREAQNLSTVGIQVGHNRLQPEWWNEEIEQLRIICNNHRRSLTRARGRDMVQTTIEGLEASYKSGRKNLKRAIRRAQRRKWEELCSGLEEDPWGRGYQIVTGSMRHLRTPYDLHHTIKVE